METKDTLPFLNQNLTHSIAETVLKGWEGISNSQMTRVFNSLNFRIQDGYSKTEIGFNTLMAAQREYQGSTPLYQFIETALHPSLFVQEPEKHSKIKSKLDTALRTFGFSITEELDIIKATDGVTGARALSEILNQKLIARGAHERILQYCSEELLSQSLFHATTEAAKSLFERIRQWGFSDYDGRELVEKAFGSRKHPGPYFINEYTTPAEQAAHHGFIHLLIGIYGHVRSDRAHRTRCGSNEDEQDFLDLMSMISYAHRVLDSAKISTKYPSD